MDDKALEKINETKKIAVSAPSDPNSRWSLPFVEEDKSNIPILQRIKEEP